MKNKNTRRDFLKKSAFLTAAAAGMSALGNKAFSEFIVPAETSPFSLPPLPYDYAALEPHIDTITMQIHHDKHHAAYVNNLNKALADTKTMNISLEEILQNISSYPTAVRNNGGGHWNHSMFWKIMHPPKGENVPSGDIIRAIDASFGSMDDFKKIFNETSLSRFGSGWTWVIVKKGKLSIGSTPNQDNPLMNISDDSSSLTTGLKGTPVLCLDVWEHAYYLKYQNKRADYVNAFWNVINWDEVNKRWKEAR